MARPEVGAQWVEVPAGGTSLTKGPAVEAARLLAARLEPLIVEANLAGYEIVSAVARNTSSGAAPCLFLGFDNLFIATELESWDELVGVPVTWGSGVMGALALRFQPRLAMREEVTAGGGSTQVSSYGIPFTVPAPWTGAVSSNTGGWVAVTTTGATPLPSGLGTIVGDAAKGGTAARTLRDAIRAAARARWTSHGGTAGQLGNCGLGALFDPGTWAHDPLDREMTGIGTRVRGHLWRNAKPSYDDLVDSTLQRFIELDAPLAPKDVIEDVQARLRSELLRRALVDLDGVAGGAPIGEEKLGPRVLDLFAEVETFGRRPLPLDLFLLLELGLVSLSRRVAAEEALPAVISREWTDPCVTGRYDQVGTPAPIDLNALADPERAPGVFGTIIGESNTVALNQAGDHVMGHWQERILPNPGTGPVTFRTWAIQGERDHGHAGLRFDAFFFAPDGNEGPGTLTFTRTADGLELEVEYDGDAWTLLRPASLARTATRGVEEVGVPLLVEPVTPFMSDMELGALVEPLRERIEPYEKFWLSPAELALADALATRLAADLDVIARDEMGGGIETLYMIQHFETGFGYFFRGASVISDRPDDPSQASPHRALAAVLIRERLRAMPGDGSPLDEWQDPAAPPATYLNGLAHALTNAGGSAATTEGLGLRPWRITQLTVEHVYRYRMASRFLAGGTLGDFITESPEVVRIVLTHGLRGLTKLDNFSVGPGADVVLDFVTVEFQKVRPYPDDHWPGDPVNPGTVVYGGFLFGGGGAFAALVNLDYSTDWSDINTGSDHWTPQDFEGWMWSAGGSMGWTFFGVEGLAEPLFGWLYSHIWSSVSATNFRTMGEYTYTSFLADPPKEDASSWSFTFIDSWGAWIGVNVLATAGYLWLPEDEDGWGEDEIQTSQVLDDRSYNSDTAFAPQVCFEVGRSELTAEGEALLRSVAALHLRALASRSTVLTIVGHASPDDARALYNQTLSERRAVNVVRYLRAYVGPLLAVQPGRLLAYGLGDWEARDAVRAGDDPADWRRVDIEINGALVLRMVAL
jgi:outer membrane protein OmpA-like peptidoglycan-associated protein